jgi:glyoxylase-like metal-dependent hydrolase (beta-lactamase superfamily II)
MQHRRRGEPLDPSPRALGVRAFCPAQRTSATTGLDPIVLPRRQGTPKRLRIACLSRRAAIIVRHAAAGNPGLTGVYADSVEPILEAGLADVVEEDADLGGGLRLEPTPGHTPGHVSLWIESEGEVVLVTGDFLHHPVQCAELSWAEIGDEDPDAARATRRRMLARAAEKRAIVFGTHFATRPAGRVERVGEAFRFVPL